MMASQKTRLTLELDAALKARLKAAAASKGMSMREYCQSAIKRQLSADAAPPATRRFSEESLAKLDTLGRRVVGDRQFTDDSAKLLREIRDERARYQ